MAESRWLDATAAAAYISVRVDSLRRLVKQGRIPEPSYTLGTRSPRWDREALDAVFDGGADSTNVDMTMRGWVQRMGEEAEAKRAKRAAREAAKPPRR